ncbi:MAG: anti-sigma regulatory factor [Anaerolineae bacterium]|nr:anti-sigma regulatory factor [Anaerolineae bacterium]
MATVVRRSEKVLVTTQEQVVLARNIVKKVAASLGFALTDQTKLMTAASELARNMVVYAGGGEMLLQELNDGFRNGIRLTFEDHGPGIQDVAQAMVDGYTTGGGLGLGLSGAKRLVQEFNIASIVGEGTRVIVTQWK